MKHDKVMLIIKDIINEDYPYLTVKEVSKVGSILNKYINFLNDGKIDESLEVLKENQELLGKLL